MQTVEKMPKALGGIQEASALRPVKRLRLWYSARTLNTFVSVKRRRLTGRRNLF